MFTIRIYGAMVERLGPSGTPHVLVMDEIIKGREITKFPGGGLEYGEGPKECLVREIREELGLEAVDLEHLYTTDFFQQSVFHERPLQVLSIYYRFRVKDMAPLKLLGRPFGFSGDVQEGARWLSLSEGREEDLSLPMDRHVFNTLQDAFRAGQFTSS